MKSSIRMVQRRVTPWRCPIGLTSLRSIKWISESKVPPFSRTLLRERYAPCFYQNHVPSGKCIQSSAGATFWCIMTVYGHQLSFCEISGRWYHWDKHSCESYSRRYCQTTSKGSSWQAGIQFGVSRVTLRIHSFMPRKTLKERKEEFQINASQHALWWYVCRPQISSPMLRRYQVVHWWRICIIYTASSILTSNLLCSTGR